MRKNSNNIIIEGARIIFRNFSGKDGKYNSEGKKNFCVFLDYELGKTLEADGWNIRWLQPKDDQEDDQAYMQVTVSFENMPPKIVMVTSRGKTILDAESVSILDWADIADIDLIISPYHWGPIGGKSGIKGYVKSMYVTIAEDEFEKKYYNVPESEISSIGESLCRECANVEECQMKGHCAGLNLQ